MTENISRRDFLKLATPGMAVWTIAPRPIRNLLPRLALVSPQAGPAGDVLVVVFQRGGMDGLNAVIPLGEADYYRKRPSLSIPEPATGAKSTAIDLDGFFGLHPSLNPFKNLWDDKSLAIIHACGSPDPTHSHFDAMDYMERGTPGEKQIPTGWLARHLQTASWENDSPFRAIGFGTMLQGSLRGPVPVTVLKSITDFHLGGRVDAREISDFQIKLSEMYNLGGLLDPAAALTFSTAETLQAIINEGYTPSGNVEYPQTEFGQSMLQVAQLIKAGIGLEIAAVDIGGWDTHVRQGGQTGLMPNLLSEFALGLAAFYADLGALTQKVTVVTMSEFGRRVQENGGGGTDHGHGGVMFLLGGSVNGGKVYGDWPGLDQEVLDGPGDLSITTDFRDILGEIVKKRLLNEKLSEVFPGHDRWRMREVLSAD